MVDCVMWIIRQRCDFDLVGMLFCVVALCFFHLVQSNPGYYGRGAYFAESAAYSNGTYAFINQCTMSASRRQLLLVRVLCGETRDYGRARCPELKKPPPGSHSVCGGPHLAGRCASGTKMWIVYDRAQVYPAYVVTYDVPLSHMHM